MNLPAVGWVSGRSHGRGWSIPRLRRRAVFNFGELLRQPCLAVVALGSVVVGLAAILELINFRNGWVAYEDISCAAAPIAATAGIALSGALAGPEYRRLRTSLAISMALVAVGQVAALIPDLTDLGRAPLASLSEVCYVLGAVLGVFTLLASLYARLRPEDRWAVALNGFAIIAAAMTFVFANWIHQSSPAGRPGCLLRGSGREPVRPARFSVVLLHGRRGRRGRPVAAGPTEQGRRLGSDRRHGPPGDGLGGLARALLRRRVRRHRADGLHLPGRGLAGRLGRRDLEPAQRRRRAL